MHFPAAATNPLRSRDDIQQVVRDLVHPLLPHFTRAGSGISPAAHLPWYGEPAASLEGFARPLWGLAPLAAGGGTFDHWGRWRDGLAAGTDPGHAGFWGWPQDEDQRIVEAAALAFAVGLCPAELWTPLAPAVRERVSAWLQRAGNARPVDNNWHFFCVIVGLGLRRRGADWPQERIDRHLQRLDEFHLGEGWYSDGMEPQAGGNGRRGDYYVPMAMHFYALLYAAWSDPFDAARCALYRQRAVQFAPQFALWFAADGAAVPYGRSLTYRFAQGAFWGALAYAGVEALPWPVLKGLYLRHLRWWLRQPAFSESGVLSVGYAYPNLAMAETYNGPGSSYWACKMFLPLALPAEHPFWMAEEAALPARSRVVTVAGAGMVLASSPAAEDVVALCPGQPVQDWPRHAAAKYSKFAYSSRCGFSVPVGRPSLSEGGFDSTLALSDDGQAFRTREQALAPQVGNGVAYSRWQPWVGVQVDTWLVAGDASHVRVHRIRSDRRLLAADAGFAVGAGQGSGVQAWKTEDGDFCVGAASGFSALRDLTGAREPACIALAPNSHLLHPLAWMPVVQGWIEPGVVWLGAVAFAAARPCRQPLWQLAVAGNGREFQLLRDGALWCALRMSVGAGPHAQDTAIKAASDSATRIPSTPADRIPPA